MDREQKAAAVAELTEDLKGAEAIFAVDYRGISVTEAAELRGKLREADAVLKVVKNRLAKRAAAEAGTELEALLVGPTALTLIKGDPVTAAKAIADFAKLHHELEYKGGIMDGAALDPEAFMVIARLPGLEVLHGQLVGMVASPLTGLVRGLGAMISGLAIALGQIAEQGLVAGEPPAEAEPATAEEAPEPEPEAAEPEAVEEPAEDAPATQPDAAEEAPAAEEEQPAAEEVAPAPEPEEPAAEPDELAAEGAAEPEAAEPPAETSDTQQQGGGDEEAPADQTENNDDDESSEEAPAAGEASEETESEE